MLGSGSAATLAEHAGALARSQQPHARVHPLGLRSALGTQLQRPAAARGRGRGRLDAAACEPPSQIEWTVPPGSTLRLQQLLAQAGYLPVDWQPSGAPVARTPSAEAQAAVDASERELQLALSEHPDAACRRCGRPGQANEITSGAVMKFENTNELTVDGVAGADRLARAARRRDRRQAL